MRIYWTPGPVAVAPRRDVGRVGQARLSPVGTPQNWNEKKTTTVDSGTFSSAHLMLRAWKLSLNVTEGQFEFLKVDFTPSPSYALKEKSVIECTKPSNTTASFGRPRDLTASRTS